MKKSEQVALCGVVAALCTLLMFMTGMFPFSTYALPALAGLLFYIGIINRDLSDCKLILLVLCVPPTRESMRRFP